MDSGATVTRVGGWTYLTEGVINAVAPASCLVNIKVIISAPTSNSGATVTEVGGWTYLVAGSISSASPSSGHAGTRVTISGQDLLGGGVRIANAFLAGVAVESVESSSDTTVVVVAAASVAVSGSVKLVADTGAAIVRATSWTYVAAGVVTRVSPSSGQLGTRVTISGTGLFGGGSSVASVSFGSVATSFVDANSTTVIVDAQAGGVAGVAVDVTIVANTGARVVAAGGWTPVSAGVISAVTPNNGQGGSRVNITGSNLLGGGSSIVSVSLAGVSVASIAEGKSNTIVRVVAGVSASSGSGDVVPVANTGATVTLVGGFTYLTAGSISTVTPSSGQDGTLVEIAFANFIHGGESIVSVSFGSTPAASFVQVSNTLVRAVLQHASAGVVDVRLVSSTGAVVDSLGGFTYLVRGVISSVSPNTGQDGSSVVISGLRLLGGGSSITSVTLAGVPVVSITSFSDSSVVVETAFSASAGPGAVTLTADTGAVITLSNGFTYLLPGQISSVTPSFGQRGTLVEVLGTRFFADGASVVSATLASTPATAVENSNTRVLLRATAALPVVGNVVLTSNTGIRTTLANGWTYRQAGEIEAVTPSQGQVGTRAIVYGPNLRGHSAAVTHVSLASFPATIIQQTNFFVQLTAGTGPEDGVTGDVIVTTASGAHHTLANGWTYVLVGNITSVAPSSGTRNTVVTIASGNLFSGGSWAALVSLAGVSVSSIVSQTPTGVVVLAGFGTSEVGDVLVTSDTGGIATFPNGWRYILPGDIRAIIPDRGQVGTIVTILGSSLPLWLSVPLFG